jgi:hypothetical protein
MLYQNLNIFNENILLKINYFFLSHNHIINNNNIDGM